MFLRKICGVMTLLLAILLSGGSTVGAQGTETPLDEFRGLRSIEAISYDERLENLACQWAEAVSGGASTVDPELSNKLLDTIGDNWVRSSQVIGLANSEAGLWVTWEADDRYVSAAIDGSYNRLGFCAVEGSEGTGGTLIFVSDAIAGSLTSGELPDEPVRSTAFSIGLLAAAAAVAVSVAALLISTRRR